MITTVELDFISSSYLVTRGELDNNQQDIVTSLVEHSTDQYLSSKKLFSVSTLPKGDDLQHIYAWDPHQIIIIDKDSTLYRPGGIDHISKHEVPTVLPRLADQLAQQLSDHNPSSDISLYLGYHGYLAFELSRLMEEYRSRKDCSRLPQLFLFFPTKILVQSEHRTILIFVDLPHCPHPQIAGERVVLKSGINHFTDINQYLSDVTTITDYIRKGDIYQANYTQQFGIELDDPPDLFSLYSTIQEQQHLHGGAYQRFGAIEIFSLSPEVFLRISNGEVITKPIKGTRPRGKTDEEDVKYRSELITSAKDQAELAMIVDLLRNDLGKSSIPASVEVVDHAVVESYENVHHLVSTIRSRIEPNFGSAWSLLLRAFPGGSISGVPKIRSLEIIESLEKVPRGVYTGNMGFISLWGDLSMNIAIRTAVIANNQVFFNAGGGIVYDSLPEEEYMESLHKAKHLVSYFGSTFTGHLIWINGDLRESEEYVETISNTGCFETIRVENGVIRDLDLHLSRLDKGIEFYGFARFSLPSRAEIQRFCNLNLAVSARLNIFIYQDHQTSINVYMKIQEYKPPDSKPVLVLDDSNSTIPEPMKHGIKSLEYELYRTKTRQAEDIDGWDMIIIDSQDRICEGGKCTLYFYSGGWITSGQNIVEGIIRSKLIRSGQVEEAVIYPEDLDQVTAVAVSNVLIGVRYCERIVDTHGQTIWKSQDKMQFDRLTY